MLLEHDGKHGVCPVDAIGIGTLLPAGRRGHVVPARPTSKDNEIVKVPMALAVACIPFGFLVVFEKPNRSSFTFTFTYTFWVTLVAFEKPNSKYI